MKSPDSEEESLTGAKLYVSELCSKYSVGEEQPPSPAPGPEAAPPPFAAESAPGKAQQKLAEAQEKLKEEGANLQNQMSAIPIPLHMEGDPRNVQNGMPSMTKQDEPHSVQRKIVLGLFILACALYILVPIIDSVSNK